MPKFCIVTEVNPTGTGSSLRVQVEEGGCSFPEGMKISHTFEI